MNDQQDKKDQEEIIRGYSPEVTRRLIALTSPYKLAVFITVITLIAATVAELLTPIVIQRTLDNYLLRREYRLELAAVEAGAPGRELADKLLLQGKVTGPYIFVPINSLKDLNGKQKEKAVQEGWLDKEDWYVFQSTGEESAQVVEKYAGLILSSLDWHAIKISDRDMLSRKERQQIRQNDYMGLTRGTLQYLGLLAVILIFTFGQVYTASWIAQRVMADMRGFLFNHIIRQSLSYLSKTPVGSLVSRVTSDVGTIAEFFDNVSTSFLKDFALMAGVVAVMFMLDVKLTLVSMAALIPTIILILIFRKKMREAFRRVRSRVSVVTSFLSERISGMSTVQLLDTEKQSARDFDKKGEQLLNAELSQIRYMAVFRPLIELITSAAIALVLWYSTDLHQSGLVTLGVLIAFVELIQKFFQPVRDIAEKFNILQSAMAGGERVFAMLDSADRIPDTGTDTVTCADPNDTPLAEAGQYGEITFENVHFSYIPGEPILQDLSFTLPPGTTTAIVGATGSGKTTIANLLTRLWEPQKGRILLDGRDIRDRSLADLRETIQPVQQDVFLFSGTIADNIDLGIGCDEKKIKRAAELAKAETFIRRLPKGFQTEITEGAVNLSAGQRQLIAFARIIASNPRIIILDEATANIDTETESFLQTGLESLLQNRTALIIAHRLSTIRRADRILVLGHGSLLEDGTHEELLAQGGVYHDLYELQFS